MKTYLVTGAAGFIGANYLKYILKKYADKEDIKVIVVDALTYAGNLGTIREELKNPGVKFEKVDIRDRKEIERIFSENDVDYVVNFAAESHVDRSIENPQIFLETNILGTQNLLENAKKAWTVSKDENWRVQEVLAKAFDEYCRKIGYEQALPVIDEWLGDIHPNTRRAVTEGLRIWTSRSYFKEHPEEAIKRIAALKEDSSEYVRKSVGNALRDISKKYPELIKAELDTWNIEKKSVKQVYQLASRFIEK